MARRLAKPGCKPAMLTDAAKLDLALDRKRAKRRCLSCGESAWTALETTSILTAMGDDQVVRTGVGIEVAAVVCQRCGFVRLHSTHHLFAEPA